VESRRSAATRRGRLHEKAMLCATKKLRLVPGFLRSPPASIQASKPAFDLA
jgi:hypothetical protein